MPKIVNISTSYRNRFKNGDTYTDNLTDYTDNYTGVIMEQVQCTIDVSIEWFSNADFIDSWQVDGANNIIIRTVGSFSQDGFKVGQKFRFISGWASDNSAPNEFEAVIDFIRQDGLRMDFSVTSGVVSSTGAQTDVGIRALGNAPENYLTGIVYKFGFVENSAAASFTSLVTENNMGYQFGGIPRSVSSNELKPIGNVLDWVTGQGFVSFISESDYTQNFQIKHEFVVHPWFRDGELNNIQNSIPPNEFEGTNSLKHVFDLDFRQTLSNPNTSISQLFTDSLGSVGWFDENYNGLGDDYNIVSISYKDTSSSNSVDGLQAALSTTVTIEIEKEGGAFVAGQKVGLSASLLPPQSQYQDKTTTLLENFLYDSLYHVEGSGTTIGSDFIKSVTSSIVSGNLVVVAEFEYNALQQAVLSSITNPYYVLGFTIADISLTNQNSDRLTLKEVNQYVLGADVDGLIDFDRFDFYFAGNEIGVDVGYTNFTGWNEDSLAIDFNFTLNRDPLKDAVLNTIEFALIAYNENTGESFDLDSTTIDLSEVIVSSGVQQIEIDSQRGYLFEDGNQYKDVSVTTGLLVGTIQNYSGVFAQKIRWEDWIKNLFADTVFFNSGSPNNGLNFKSSNYSGVNNYGIRLAVRANVQGLDDLGVSRSTDYQIISPELIINDYNTGIEYTCIIETFRESNLAPLGGSVLVGENTLVRATFTASSGAITNLTGFWASLKIQTSSDSGQQISEISTTYIDSSNLLIPKDGFVFLDMQIVGGNVVCECIVNGNKSESVNYNISARIDAPPLDECFVEFMNGDCVEFMNGDLAKFQNQ